MALRSGIDAQLGLKAEATYGTGVTVDRFLEFASEGLGEGHVGSVETYGLGRGRYLKTDRVRKYAMGATGPITFDVQDTSFGLLLKHLLGSSSSSNVGAVYTHTITPDDTNGMFGLGLTMQIGRPGTGGTVHPFTYAGCKVTDWELSCALNEALKLTANFHAQSVTTATALATKSYPSDARPFIFVDGSLTVGGTAVLVKKASIKGDNGLNVDRLRLGSGLVREPIAAAVSTVMGELDAEFVDLTQYAAWLAGTQAQLILDFASSRIISGADAYRLRVTIPAIEYTGSVPTVGGPDIVDQALPWRMLKGAGAAITIEYITSDTVI